MKLYHVQILHRQSQQMCDLYFATAPGVDDVLQALQLRFGLCERIVRFLAVLQDGRHLFQLWPSDATNRNSIGSLGEVRLNVVDLAQDIIDLQISERLCLLERHRDWLRTEYHLTNLEIVSEKQLIRNYLGDRSIERVLEERDLDGLLLR